jgi:hypothetical protein
MVSGFGCQVAEADVKKQMTEGREQKIEVIEFGSGHVASGP